MVRPLALLAVVSFILHLAWERAHIGLYTGYEALEGILPVYVFATIGDVLYTLLIVTVLTYIFGRRILIEPRVREYGLFAALGLCVAIFVEQKAYMLGRWEYTNAMPTLYGLGLSPLLQMILLLPLSVFVVERIERWLNRDL